MENILSVENLKFEINNKHILKNINFNIKSGEIVGLIGINGCGKTTLLKCLNGINKISTGDIKIKKSSLLGMNPNEIAKKVALMGQNTNLNILFNCLDVVVMGRYPHLEKGKHFSNIDYEKAVLNMEITNTLKFRNKNINNLSGGERQRVLFSKALTQETDVILLDEPTASMDLSNQEQLFKICKELKKRNKSIIVSTHDLRVAARYCDKLLLLKDGEEIAFGNVEDVLTKVNIKKAYGVDAEVFINPVSKTLDYYIF